MSNKADSKATEEKIDRDDVFVIDDDCDEDVPGDFFDDFLKEDFMAGLDIVDDDQWENGKMKKDEKEDLVKDNKGKTDVKESAEKFTKRKKSKRDRPNRGDKSKGIDADEFDIRRDPNKTKRDIQRDKAKCEKDKEKKMITEKLKLVETGLVPPGMEMDVDISTIENKNDDKRKSGSKNDSPPRRRRSRVRSISPRRPRASSPRRRSRNRSPLRISPRRSPRRSPIRRKSRERISRERRSRERSIERTLRSLRRSRSGSLHRDRRSRYSPEYPRRRRRTRSRSRDKKRVAKKSFLQEIVEKLRETRPANSMMPPSQYIPPGAPPPHLQPPLIQSGQPVPPHVQHLPPSSLLVNPIIPGTVQPIPVPAPTFPVINSQPLPSQPTQYDPYDQSFFIGKPQQPGNFGTLAEQHSPMVQGPGLVQKSDGGLTNSQATLSNKQIDIPEQQVGKVMNYHFVKSRFMIFFVDFSYFMIRR